MADVFISYGHEDRHYVEKLAAYLESCGLTVWYDHSLTAADHWTSVIEREIRACRVLIIVMSPHSADRVWVEREFHLAEELGKILAPLLLQGSRFWYLAERQFEDVSGGVMPSRSFIERLGGEPPHLPRRPEPSVAARPRRALKLLIPAVAVIAVLSGAAVALDKLTGSKAGPGPSASSTVDPRALPETGACYLHATAHDGYTDYAQDSQKVSCATPHQLETIEVKALTGSYPGYGSQLASKLFADCEKTATTFLGGYWRIFQVWLVLSVPSEKAWQDGAHWYRCDVAPNAGVMRNRDTKVTGSLRGNVAPGVPAKITCMTWKWDGQNISQPALSSCDVPHQGELAGLTDLTGINPDDRAATLPVLRERCRPVIADYLGQPTLAPGLLGWYFWHTATEPDNSVLCVITGQDPGRAYSTSMRGLGTKAIPYAS